MSTTHSDGGDEPTLSRKERYEKLLQVAEYQTGGPETPLPAGARKAPLLHTASGYGRCDGMSKAYVAAIQNEDLLPWKDRDGRVRVTLIEHGALEDLVAEERRRDDTCIELIDRARELQEAIADAE